MYNSTIKQKRGICQICKDGREKPLTNKLCGYHYQLNLKLKSVNKVSRKELFEEGLPELIEEADIVFSRYIRLKGADENGYNTCFTSGVREHYTKLQCGHFIGRSCMFLRYDERNCRPQSAYDNCNLHGNLVVFAQKLEEQNSGIVEILLEESRDVYKYTREELRQIISDYSNKLLKLKK